MRGVWALRGEGASVSVSGPSGGKVPSFWLGGNPKKREEAVCGEAEAICGEAKAI